MRKIVSALVVVSMVSVFAACGKDAKSVPGTKPPVTPLVAPTTESVLKTLSGQATDLAVVIADESKGKKDVCEGASSLASLKASSVQLVAVSNSNEKAVELAKQIDESYVANCADDVSDEAFANGREKLKESISAIAASASEYSAALLPSAGGNGVVIGGAKGEKPGQKPEVKPTQAPTAKPTQAPTAKPTQAPTAKPTQKPTQTPTQKPTQAPTQKPTQTPTQKPTQAPTQKPTQTPTQKPTQTPTQKPTQAPTQKPTQAPTQKPGQKA